jgi:hypothetical protein
LLALSLALGWALCALPCRVEAGFIQGFSGNTAPTAGRVMSTVNFAVLDTAGGNGNDTWNTGFAQFDTTFKNGTGSPKALDTTAFYLYLYQVTNDFPAGNANFISFTTIPLGVPLASITSWGWFTGLGLSDAFGQVTSANFFGNTRTRGNPAVANTGVTTPSVVALANGSYVTPFDASVSNRPDKFSANWVNGGNPIAAQQRSLIFGFTTDIAPRLIPGTVSGRATGQPPTTATGTLPSPTPEPASVVLLGTGVLLAAWFRRRGPGRCQEPRA